jgi:hypothetical protein
MGGKSGTTKYMQWLRVNNMRDERTTEKYRNALTAAIELEKSVKHGYKEQELESWEPDYLYHYLFHTWWLEWNGLLQHWTRQ